jgi:hypothetical protein
MREAAKNRPPEDQDELPRRSRAGPVSGVSEARMDRQYRLVRRNFMNADKLEQLCKAYLDAKGRSVKINR